MANGAANHFLDAAVPRLAVRGTTPWISVDWDVWQHHQDEKRAPFRSRQGDGRQGDPARRRPGSDSPRDACGTSRRWRCPPGTFKCVSINGCLSVAEANPAASRAGYARPEISQQYLAPRTELEKSLAEIVSEALGPRTGRVARRHLRILGGDSLLLVRLLSDVRDRHGVNVALADFLNEPTTAAPTTLVGGPGPSEGRCGRTGHSDAEARPDRDAGTPGGGGTPGPVRGGAIRTHSEITFSRESSCSSV